MSEEMSREKIMEILRECKVPDECHMLWSNSIIKETEQNKAGFRLTYNEESLRSAAKLLVSKGCCLNPVWNKKSI